MKRNRRRLAALLCALAAMLLPVQALAAGSIDLKREVSLTVSCQDGGKPLSGIKYDLYLVATVAESGELTATKEFAGYPVDIRGRNDEAWQTLAATLEGYVLRDGVKPADNGQTNQAGCAAFPTEGKTLTPGLYLVLGSRITLNGYRYEPAPFLVQLPALDAERNAWSYEVTAGAKYESWKETGGGTVMRKVLKVWKDAGDEQERPEKVEVQLLRDGKVYDTVTLSAQNSWRYTWTELSDQYSWTVVEKEQKGYTASIAREGITFVVTNTSNGSGTGNPAPTATPKPSQSGQKLPQTGQLWWPVPLLICAGLLFVVIGLVRRRGMENEKK